MAKFDLYSQTWIDVIFRNRNKEFGAYKLRQESLKDQRKALIFAILFFIPFIALPIILDFALGKASFEEEVVYTEVTLEAPPPLDELEEPPPPPPPPKEPPPPKVDKIKFPPPVVKPDEEVEEEEVPTVEELREADPGQETVEGDPDAEILIDEPEDFGKGDVVEDNEVRELFAVEVYPLFPGGEKAMQKFLYKNIRYPVLAKENNVQGRVYLTFIVEKDGSVSNVKVLRGIGAGCDEEAKRVIGSMPKWKPGIQNGRPVRIKYSLPVVYKLAN